MTFTIIQTQTTPLADFRDGYLLIRGKSVPFDPPVFFETLRERLYIYSEHPEKSTLIEINLTAVNAISKRSIVDTFRFLEDLKKTGTSLKVNWYYESDNEDILELGEICKSSFEVEVELCRTA